MAKKTVNLKEIVDDINAGMHDNQLMVKHELSPGQLAKVMAKLEAMGHVQGREKVGKTAVASRTYSPPITCPNCRAPVPAGSADCPKCGIVVTKYQQTAAPSESAEHRIRSAAARTSALPPTTASGGDYASKLILVAVLAAVVLIPYGAYRWFKSGMDKAVIESHSAVVRTILKDVDEGSPDYFSLAKKLQHSIGYNMGGGAKKASGSPEMEKLGQVYATLLELGGLEGNLRLRVQAQRTAVPQAVQSAAPSKRSEAENRLAGLQTDLSNLETRLNHVREIAAQVESESRLNQERMAAEKGQKIVWSQTITTKIDGETVEGLELKRQLLMDKINSESAKMMEIEEPAAQPPAVESPTAEKPEVEDLDELRERLEAIQEKLVALCNEYLTMVGQSPAVPEE